MLLQTDRSEQGPGVFDCNVEKEKGSAACVKLYHEVCLKRNDVELPRYKKDFIRPFCKLQALVAPVDPGAESDGNASHNMNNLCADNGTDDSLVIEEHEDDANNVIGESEEREDTFELNASENTHKNKVPRFMRSVFEVQGKDD